MRRAAPYAALALSILAASAVVTSAGPARRGHSSRPAISRAASLPPPSLENASWSGELAWASQNGTSGFTQVRGAWIQPRVAAAQGAQYADTWVGIDGFDGTLLQAGTTASTRDGTVSYAAWFVAWNGATSGMTVVDEPVTSGDQMAVAIVREPAGTWHVVLADRTAGWTWSTTVDYPADGSSAEWIEEAPGTWSTSATRQTLADYGAATFTTLRADGHAPLAVTSFEIAQHGTVVSYPSTYDASLGSFTVHYGTPPPITNVTGPTPGPGPGPSRGAGSVVFAGGGRRGAAGARATDALSG